MFIIDINWSHSYLEGLIVSLLLLQCFAVVEKSTINW